MPLKLVRKDRKLDEFSRIELLVRNESTVVVLGDPGAGKSTLLDFLIHLPTEPEEKIRFVRDPRRWVASRLVRRLEKQVLPLYIPLRSCKPSNETFLEDINDPDCKILSAPVKRFMPPDFIEAALRRGQVLLLLDGLDEVSDRAAYLSAVKKVNQLDRMFPGKRFVVTCRKAGWQGGLDDAFQTYNTLPLDYDQQRSFVHKWYQAVLKHVHYGNATRFGTSGAELTGKPNASSTCSVSTRP